MLLSEPEQQLSEQSRRGQALSPAAPQRAGELGRDALEGAYSVGTSGPVDIEMLQKTG